MTHEDSHLNCVSQRRSWCLYHWGFNDSPRFGDSAPGRSPWSRYGSTLLQLGALASNGSCLAMWRCGLATSRRFEVGPKLMTLEWNMATSRIPTDDVTVDFPSYKSEKTFTQLVRWFFQLSVFDSFDYSWWLTWWIICQSCPARRFLFIVFSPFPLRNIFTERSPLCLTTGTWTTQPPSMDSPLMDSPSVATAGPVASGASRHWRAGSCGFEGKTSINLIQSLEEKQSFKSRPERWLWTEMDEVSSFFPSLMKSLPHIFCHDQSHDQT